MSRHVQMRATLALVFLATSFATSLSAAEPKSAGRSQKAAAPLNLKSAVLVVSPSVVQVDLLLMDPSPETEKDLRQWPVPSIQRLGAGSWVIVRLGTGFIVDERGYIVTARHVTKAADEFRDYRFPSGHKIEATTTSLVAGFAQPNSDSIRDVFTFVGVQVVEDDRNSDLALLKLAKNLTEINPRLVILTSDKPTSIYAPAPAKLSTVRPEDGEPIALSGYPLNQPVLVTTSGAIVSGWSTAEMIGRSNPEDANGDRYLGDLRVNHGNSGGPVYSISTGKVIGICDAFVGAPVEATVILPVGLSYNSGLAVIIPIKYAIDLLKKHGLN